MNDTEFDNFLKSARTDLRLPASFKQRVWHRIESDSLASPAIIIDIQKFSRKLDRPWSFAVGIAATVTLGLWLGIASVPEPKDGKVTYAMSISPFSHAKSE
ncbi:MAG: hypothetical protein H8M99_02810 [Gloeobacteraceae cyanobacterium ES-bin-144]|nr:hypothetical protein [Verrucomicrobiales bacterium]